MSDFFNFSETIMVSYTKKIKESTGGPLKIVPLKSLIMDMPNKPKNAAKNSLGDFWMYNQNILGVNAVENCHSDGIVAVDIDNITKEESKTIFESFEKLCKVYTGLVCCTYSWSYYNHPMKGGLHFVIKTEHEKLYYSDTPSYKYYEILYGAALCWAIYKLTEIDLRPTKIPSDDGDTKTRGIDSAMKTVGQRLHINYSEVKWNNYVYSMEITEEQSIVIREWFDGYTWFEKKNDYKITKCELQSIDFSSWNGQKFNKLGHKNRITILNALSTWGIPHDKRVSILMNICGPGDYAGGVDKLKAALEQTSRTAEHQTIPESTLVYAKGLLEKVGINVDLILESLYQPIDYNIDNEFEEIWKSEKDRPFYNKYYNPENLLKIHLEENEFIGDYSLEINEFVYKYPATYLKGDAGDGKTTHALNSSFNSQLFKNEFVLLMQGDSIDLCVPYNSVADNKAKSEREDIKRVMTANVEDFSDNKRNVFIWNTIMPLYEQYYKSGVVKRMVLFFDESHKIVTDDFRWRTVFELFKALPTMYKHFVFMTGTPAYEHEFLLQYFPNMGFIDVTKKSKYKKTCNILKYPSFGVGDMVELIKNHINNNKLPLVYSNYRNSKWKHALDVINKERITEGETPLRILDYSRPNALNDEVKKTNELNSIKEFDVVIGTKYLSVGIDFVKDDDRMRVPIVDYAGERDCTSLDIWQFQARNREQDVEIEIIALDNEDYYKKLYNLQFYKQLFLDMAKVHTHSLIIDIDDESEEIKDEWSFMLKLYNERKFGRYEIEERKVDGKKVVTNWFKDQKNVTLLGLYYRYVKLFSNMNMIKAMLRQRGVTITETQMSHIKAEIEDDTIKHEVFQFFIDNWNEISDIVCCLGQYDEKCYKIDINRTDKEHIIDGKIWVRDTKYMSWLIKNFAGKDEWKKILEEHGFINSNHFAKFNRAKRISKVLTKKNIEKIKKFMSKDRTEKAITDFALTLLESHYEKLNLDYNCLSDRLKMQDVIDDYANILEFVITHIEFIEQLKNAENDAEGFTVFAKMQMVMEMELQEKKNKKNSDSHKQQITVVWEDDMTEQSFESIDALAKEVGYSKGTISKILSGKQNNHKRKFTVKNS